MKLLETYSLVSGLKIGQQDLIEAFFPLPFEKYITIQAGSSMAAKNYPYYAEVVTLLKPHLDKAGIHIVQLGGKDDSAIPECYHLQGHTNLHQSNYLLARAQCHVGNDSWLAHRAGYLKVPLVAVYGPTDPKNHGPTQYDPSKTALIESHRFGRRPTFAAQETPQTIALIPPEQIANAVLKVLGPSMAQLRQVITTDLAQYEPMKVSRQSLYFGEVYGQNMVQLVPDSVVHPSVNVVGPLIVRMDLAADWADAESKLLANLQLRPCAILTDRELNLNHLIQLKKNVAAIRVEVGKVSSAWIKAVRRLGVQTAFFSSEQDPEKLARLRLDLYDACLFDQYIPPTREDFLKGTTAYLNKTVDGTLISDRLYFKTRKLLLSGGKIFLSEAHWRAGIATSNSDQNSARIIDTPEFWEDLSHIYVYSE